jgi:hypothetical protein
VTTKKTIWIACAVLAAVTAACIIVYRMLAVGRVEPWALLLLAGGISILLPMLRTHFFPSARDCDAEFDFHLRRQDAYVQQQISDKLGTAVYQKIQSQQDHGPQQLADYILSRLESGEGGADPDLRSALLIALSRQHEKTGNPEAAIKSLRAAHQLRPQDFVTRFNLARNLEWQGNQAQAERIYRAILQNPAGLSRAMIKLTRRQMEKRGEG